MKGQGRFALDVLYARAKAKLWTKVERLRKLDGLRLSDFGTRRRHGFLWQRWCVEAVKEGLGPSFTGTSNVLLAMDNDLEAIGTNAHELPMVAAALAERRHRIALGALSHSRSMAPHLWRQSADRPARRLRHQTFLRDAPEWVADWTGFRPDSAPPIAAGEEIIKWWKQKGHDPKEKLLVFSDGMDVGSIEETYQHFAGRVRISFGWGTNLTNDFVGCAPDGSVDLDPISIVCKVTSVDGRPAVKLSDNPEKATGSAIRGRALSARVRQCRPRPHRRARLNQRTSSHATHRFGEHLHARTQAACFRNPEPACRPAARSRRPARARCRSIRPRPTSSRIPITRRRCSTWNAPATSTRGSPIPRPRCWKSGSRRWKPASARSAPRAAWPRCIWRSPRCSMPAIISSPPPRSMAAPSTCWRTRCRASASRPRSSSPARSMNSAPRSSRTRGW